jgi:hypothetical protein
MMQKEVIKKDKLGNSFTNKKHQKGSYGEGANDAKFKKHASLMSKDKKHHGGIGS